MLLLLSLTCNELEGLGNVATEIIGVGHLDFRHIGGFNESLEIGRLADACMEAIVEW